MYCFVNNIFLLFDVSTYDYGNLFIERPLHKLKLFIRFIEFSYLNNNTFLIYSVARTFSLCRRRFYRSARSLYENKAALSRDVCHFLRHCYLGYQRICVALHCDNAYPDDALCLQNFTLNTVYTINSSSTLRLLRLPATLRSVWRSSYRPNHRVL